MKTYTITDVANQAGVSISTVSRFFSSRNTVKPKTAAKIETVVKRLNFQPNVYARNLKKGSSNLIGFVTPDLSQSMFSGVAKKLSEIFIKNDYLLMTSDSNNDPEKEKWLIEMFLRQNVALIIVASTGNNWDYLNKVSTESRKILLFDRYDDCINVEAICENNEQNGYKLAKTLIDSGMKHPAVLLGFSSASVTKYRRIGIERALKDNNIVLTDNSVFADCIDSELTVELVKSLITKKNQCDGIIFTNPKCMTDIFRAFWQLDMDVQKSGYHIGGFTSYPINITNNYKFPCVVQDSFLLGELVGKRAMEILNTENYTPIGRVTYVNSKIYTY